MGLDGVELVIAFEEEFGVTISDAEAEALRTPRMVTNCIMSKITLTDAKVCQSQHAFYVLRKGIANVFGLNKRDIAPDAPLRFFFTTKNTKQCLLKLKEVIEARSWPELVRPFWLSNFLIALPIVTFLLTWSVIPNRFSDLTLFKTFFAGAAASFIGYAGAVSTRPLKACLPRNLVLVRDLVPFAATSSHVQWTEKDISTRVKKIVLKVLAIDEEDYLEDGDFIDHFGID